MGNSCREFDLNIGKVLENWTVAHAVREVIANALDECVLTGSPDVEIFKDASDIWHVRDFGRGIEYRHFTQNENEEKLSHPGLIGKFGVGLKDALATFERHGLSVEIESRFGLITIGRSVKHGFSDIVTLHAYFSEPRDAQFQGTDFRIVGCSDQDVKEAKEFFLKFIGLDLLESTQYGEVYLKRNGRAEIFINGIRVAEEENLLFSYNITSLNATLRKAINRERTNVGRAAYSDRIKSILLSATTDSVVNALSENLQQMSDGSQCDEMKWADVQAYAVKHLNARGNVVFVTPEEMEQSSGSILEIIHDSGKQAIFVPSVVKKKIEDAVDENGLAISTIDTVVESYNNSFEYEYVSRDELTAAEVVIFNLVPRVIALVGSCVRPDQVYISTRLRQTDDGAITLGVWERKTRRVIILRSQLKDKATFLATLIHELTHADSGYDDVSREFESALTRRLGVLAAEILGSGNDVRSEVVSSHFARRLDRPIKCSRGSSFISGLVYDPAKWCLFVKIRDSVYCYEGVSFAIAEKMFESSSLGSYYNSTISGYHFNIVSDAKFEEVMSSADEYSKE